MLHCLPLPYSSHQGMSRYQIALNPASIPPAQPPTAIPGNILPALPSFSKSSLPPVSQKVMKSLQNKEYVDLNSLLPTSLYDQVTHPHSFNLKFNPTEPGESVMAVSSPALNKVKINNAATWLQAWNIYIRGMIYFHPDLAPSMLSFQESTCNLQRHYLLTSWLGYDTAFRMNIALDKNLSWNRFDECAYDQFVRCPQPDKMSSPNSGLKCYKFSAPGHYANQCPNESYHPQSNFCANHNPSSGSFRPVNVNPSQPCRHFNNQGRCSQPNCNFPHVCNRCRGAHPGTSTCLQQM